MSGPGILLPLLTFYNIQPIEREVRFSPSRTLVIGLFIMRRSSNAKSELVRKMSVRTKIDRLGLSDTKMRGMMKLFWKRKWKEVRCC